MAPDPSKLSPSPPSTPHTPLTPPLTPGTRQHVQSQSNILRFPLSEDLVTGDHFVMVQGIPKETPYAELCAVFQCYRGMTGIQTKHLQAHGMVVLAFDDSRDAHDAYMHLSEPKHAHHELDGQETALAPSMCNIQGYINLFSPGRSLEEITSEFVVSADLGLLDDQSQAKVDGEIQNYLLTGGELRAFRRIIDPYKKLASTYIADYFKASVTSTVCANLDGKSIEFGNRSARMLVGKCSPSLTEDGDSPSRRRYPGLPRRYVSLTDSIRLKSCPPHDSPPALSRRHSTASLHEHIAGIHSLTSRLDDLKVDSLPSLHIGNIDHPVTRKLNHSASEQDLRKFSDDTFDKLEAPMPLEIDNYAQQQHSNEPTTALSPRAEAFFPHKRSSPLPSNLLVATHRPSGSELFPSYGHSFSPIDSRTYNFAPSYGHHVHSQYLHSTTPTSPYPHYLPLTPVQHGFTDPETGMFYPSVSLPPTQSLPYRLTDCSSPGSDHTVVGHSTSSGSASISIVRSENNPSSFDSFDPQERPSLRLNMPLLQSLSQHQNGLNSHAIPPRNALDLDKIERGEDTRTTIMLKNIPNKMSDRDLIQFISGVTPRKIDFLYLRMDFTNHCNVGYAFVNFIGVEDLLYFARQKLGTKWNMFSSEKVLQMSYANYQGKEALVEKFKNSCIMNEREGWRPKIFYSVGERQGLPEPFPAPTHLKRMERGSQSRGPLWGANGSLSPERPRGGLWTRLGHPQTELRNVLTSFRSAHQHNIAT